MRRSSRRPRGQRSKARKIHWTGFNFQAEDYDQLPVETALAWAKWPSATTSVPDTAPFQAPEASDETLIRSIVSGTAVYNLNGISQASLPISLVFGLIAWDSMDPTIIEGSPLVNDSTVPNPALYPGLDWIIRVPFCFTKDNFELSITADSFINSRAMRKLPPGTGILASVGFIDIIENDTHNFAWSFDVRMAFKSGYYAL